VPVTSGKYFRSWRAQVYRGDWTEGEKRIVGCAGWLFGRALRGIGLGCLADEKDRWVQGAGAGDSTVISIVRKSRGSTPVVIGTVADPELSTVNVPPLTTRLVLADRAHLHS
jgi:hypothetical protein